MYFIIPSSLPIFPPFFPPSVFLFFLSFLSICQGRYYLAVLTIPPSPPSPSPPFISRTAEYAKCEFLMKPANG
ncbi:hypothetical protein F5878DRAFT_431207 [Lentinula raphanica]|uniref:Uncharacterized protein n=1 Tax=Lentinula raphanica TaxID=153919 RepID=A0AA38PFK0_9AGAR|nr:hypothetical protein F5878DRAFT_431207 [Lentinula raphanica]